MSNSVQPSFQLHDLYPDACFSNELNLLDCFWQKIEKLAKLIGLEHGDLEADHLAIRINDLDDAKRLDTQWREHGDVISQAVINGRPIIIIKLNQALSIKSQNNQVTPLISCLELPYPSDKVYPQQGWEHVEFVIPTKHNVQTVGEFMEEVTRTQPNLILQEDKLDDMNIKLKVSSPKGEGERLANPTIAFKFEGVCIKLHPHALEEVIKSEK